MTRDIFIWWLTAQAFGLAGLPLTRFLFRALPDRGYAFGKTLGLLLTGYLAWLLAMLGLAPFGRGMLLICGLAVGGNRRVDNERTEEPKNRRTEEPRTREPRTEEPKNRRTRATGTGDFGRGRTRTNADDR